MELQPHLFVHRVLDQQVRDALVGLHGNAGSRGDIGIDIAIRAFQIATVGDLDGDIPDIAEEFLGSHP